MKKILIAIILSLIFLTKTFWAEPTLITGIWYSWFLSKDTIVSISWSNLDFCDKVVLDWKELPFILNTNTNIDLNFKDFSKYNWKIILNCSWKQINYNFSFPYIEKINYDYKANTTWEVTITGLNFTWWNFILSNWTFTPVFIWNTNAKWYLSKEIDSNEIYLSVWDLKSNLYKLDFELPKIDFLYSEKGFYEWEDIFIHWKDLNFFQNTNIYFWDKLITDFDILDNWNVLKFNTKWYQGSYDIHVTSNWFISNKLSAYIYWSKPIINNVIEKNTPEVWLQFYIYWTGFSRDLIKTDIFINGQKATIEDIKDDYILLKTYTLNNWNNNIVVYSNWFYSNSFNYFYKNWTLPEINSIEVSNVEEWIRSLKVYMTWYSNGDIIYLNWSAITPISCVWWMCRLEIDKWILKWEVKVWRWAYYSKNMVYFDIVDKYQPYIEYARVRETLEKWSRVELYWKNFYGSDISSSNLFSKNDLGVLELEISDWVVKWKIPPEYDPNSNSLVSITKYWLNFSLNFNKSNLKDGFVYAWPYITSLKSNDIIFKEWSVVNVNWFWFKDWDKVLVWWQKTLLDLKTNTFVIPYWITKWESNISIESSDDVISNIYNVYLYSADSEKIIDIKHTTLNNLSYEVNKWISPSDLVYQAELNNTIDDLYIKKFIFNVSWLNEKWLFSLYIDWSYIGDSFLTKEWTLTFDNTFMIKKMSWVKNIMLYSKSSITTDWTYNVSLKSIDWKYFNYTDIKPEFNIPLISNKITYKTWNITKCVDSDAQNLNCNSFLQWKYITSIKTKTETKVETPSVTVKNSVNNTTSTSNYFKITTSNEEIIDKITSSKVELSLSSKWKKYISQLDVLLPKIPKDNQYKLLKKIYILNDKLSASTSSKNAETIRLLNYMEAKLEYELTK